MCTFLCLVGSFIRASNNVIPCNLYAVDCQGYDIQLVLLLLCLLCDVYCVVVQVFLVKVFENDEVQEYIEMLGRMP